MTKQIVEELGSIGLEPVLAEDFEIELSPERSEAIARLRDEAEQLELALELTEAASRRREIVDLLELDLATVAHPSILADAVARLAATEQEAENSPEAIRLWRRALALRTDLRLDSTFAPRTREAFEEALRQGGTLPPRPEPESLNQLCIDLELTAVLWVAVGFDEGTLILVRMLHSSGQRDRSEVRHELEASSAQTLPEGVLEELGEDLATLLPEPEPPPPPPPPPPMDAGLGETITSRRPFYRRWWFYFTIGVVVAGAATTAGLVVGLGDREIDMVLHFP